jgi:hypothetical protein
LVSMIMERNYAKNYLWTLDHSHINISNAVIYTSVNQNPK